MKTSKKVHSGSAITAWYAGRNNSKNLSTFSGAMVTVTSSERPGNGLESDILDGGRNWSGCGTQPAGDAGEKVSVIVNFRNLQVSNW